MTIRRAQIKKALAGMSRVQRTRGVKEILKGIPKGGMGIKRFKEALKAEGLTRQARKRILAAVGKKEIPTAAAAKPISQKPTYFEKKETPPSTLKEKEVAPPKLAGQVELERKIKAGEEVARQVLGQYIEKEKKSAKLFGRPVTGIVGIPAYAKKFEQKLTKEKRQKIKHNQLREQEKRKRLEFQKEQEKERKMQEKFDTQEKETEQYFADLMNQTFKKKN